MKIQLIRLVLMRQSFDLLAKKYYRNFAVALKLAELKKLIDEKTDFYMEQEHGIITQYAAKNDDGNPRLTESGQITFESEKDAKHFSDEIIALKTTEIELGDKITIHFPTDIKEGQDMPTPEELAQLSDLVNFVVD